MQYAQSLQRYGETTRSLPAMESAYVLDPTPGTAGRLARMIQLVSLRRAGIVFEYYESGTSVSLNIHNGGSTNELAESDKRDMLGLNRAMRLWQLEMDDRIAKARGTTVASLRVALAPPHVLGAVWRRLQSADPETRVLCQELRRQKEACRQRELEYVCEHWPKPVTPGTVYPGLPATTRVISAMNAQKPAICRTMRPSMSRRCAKS